MPKSVKEEIRDIIKDYIQENEEDFIGKSFEDICWDVSIWFDRICEDAVGEGVELAMKDFPSEPDPYDEVKERLLLAKDGIIV